MKKGKNYCAKKVKIKTIFNSGFIASVCGFIVLSLISMGGIVVNIVSCICESDNKAKEIVSLIISVLSFIISVIGTIKSIKELNNKCFHRQFLDIDKNKSKIINDVTDSKNINNDYKDSGYYWEAYDGQWYISSDAVNKALLERADRLLLHVSPKKQVMSNEQREALYNIVNLKIAQGKSIFNSNLVRLRTDLLIKYLLDNKNDIEEINEKQKDDSVKRFKDLKLVEVEKTDYFLNLTTNDQIYSQLFKSDYSSIYDGKSMTVDEYNSLYNLTQSPAANIIGVSTLAITKDRHVIINRQNNNNDVNNDCFVPSGSGSSDFADLNKCLKLEKSLSIESKSEELNKKLIKYKESTENIKDAKNKVKKSDLKKEVADEGYKNYILKTQEKKDAHNIQKYFKSMKKYTCDFDHFIKYGMVRELIEESHLYDTEKKEEKSRLYDAEEKEDETLYKKVSENTIKNFIADTLLCGYIRILDRGGKPDFFGITILDLTQKEVEKMFKYGREKAVKKEISKNRSITDFNEVSLQKYVELDKLYKYSNVDDMIKNECLDKNECFDKDGKEKKIKISLQMHCLFELLLSNKDKIESMLLKKNKNTEP